MENLGKLLRFCDVCVDAALLVFAAMLMYPVLLGRVSFWAGVLVMFISLCCVAFTVLIHWVIKED